MRGRRSSDGPASEASRRTTLPARGAEEDDATALTPTADEAPVTEGGPAADEAADAAETVAKVEFADAEGEAGGDGAKEEAVAAAEEDATAAMPEAADIGGRRVPEAPSARKSREASRPVVGGGGRGRRGPRERGARRRGP